MYSGIKVRKKIFGYGYKIDAVWGFGQLFGHSGGQAVKVVFHVDIHTKRKILEAKIWKRYLICTCITPLIYH